MNLLNRIEMKNVIGGNTPPGGQSCTTDSQCPSGQSCCPVHDDIGNLGWGCLAPAMQELPGGSSEVVKCPWTL